MINIGGRGGSSGMQSRSLKSPLNPFPDSLIQDTVFHGTNVSNITEFNTRGEQSNGAIFFASDEEDAEIHGSNKPGQQYIYEVNLDIRNPLRVENKTHWGDPEIEGRYIRYAKISGNDSVVFSDGYGEFFYAVFSPEQVKIRNVKKG